MHRMHRGKTPPNECPGYDTKQSDGEVPVMLELWGMRSTPLLPSLPGPLWPGMVAPDMGPIWHLTLCIAQSAGAVEYTDDTSAEG